jgi:Xaa-Pro aminopeptidase
MKPAVGHFTLREFEQRAEKARRLMTKHKLDAMLVSSEPNIEYLSNFMCQFPWTSSSRPWYFLMPRVGEPAGIIPGGGYTNWLATSWVERVVTWDSPRPKDEGLTEIVAELRRARRRYGRLGIEMGPESRIGMTVGDLFKLIDMIRPDFEVADCSELCRELRIIKSKAEVARVRHVCQVACDAFDALPGMMTPGSREVDVTRRFSAFMLLNGADKTPYTATRSGQGGYDSIQMSPTTRKLRESDVFLIDAGPKYEGYSCDFDRNVAIGEPTDQIKRLHDVLYRATSAGIAAARPGNTAADLFFAQAKVLEGAGVKVGKIGRMGHGLGKMLTEWPSNKPDDHTKLRPGMVMTIEPVAAFGRNKILVHEENLVVTDDAPRLLTRRAPREMPVVRW